MGSVQKPTLIFYVLDIGIDSYEVGHYVLRAWKTFNVPPGCRPLFLKPKCHRKSKNGFEPINFRSPLQVIFSNYFFWCQKLSKKF